MVDLADVDTAAAGGPPPKPRRSRRFWIVLAAAVVVVAGAAVAATAVSFRYLHAAPLTSNGGAWLAPDDQQVREVEAGGYHASVIPPRPGNPQTFEIDVSNFSPVSQTILGLADGKDLANPELTGEPEHLAVSTNSEWPPSGHVRFTSDPVTLPPHTTYRLRVTLVTSRHDWRGPGGCRSEWWDGLSLRVRVGGFTRTEWVDFERLIYEIRGPGHC
jgi:hypothetical protein